MVLARCSYQESSTALTSLNRDSSSSSSRFPSIASMIPWFIVVLVAFAAAADARSLHRPSPSADWNSAAPADSDAARLGRVFRRSTRSAVDVDRHQLLEDIIRRLEAVDAAERTTGEVEELEEDGEPDWTARRRAKKAGIMGLDNLDFTSAAFDRWSNYLNSVGSNGLPPPGGVPAGLQTRIQRLGGSSGSGGQGSGAANHKLLMSLINAG